MEKSISWRHLEELYVRNTGQNSGLVLLPKLKYEHVHLTSFSKMRVDLAAQVSIAQTNTLYALPACYS